jgi:hypothetical protein
MQKRAKTSVTAHALFLIMAAVFSCDTFDGNDYILPELAQTEYYTLPGSSLIIDLTSFVSQSFVISIDISQKPTKGGLTKVNALLYKYKPALDFDDVDDQFILTAESSGKVIATQAVTIHVKKTIAELPCALIPIEDKIEVKTDSPVTISVLDNDWFCDVDKSDFKLSIHSNPRHGQTIVEGESIRYTPSSDFLTKDEFIYTLTSSTGDGVFYGI